MVVGIFMFGWVSINTLKPLTNNNEHECNSQMFTVKISVTVMDT